MASTLAHDGAGNTAGVEWPAELVQSGVASGESTGTRAGLTLARGLALFSIGLGVAQVLVPDRVARLVGVPATDTARTVLRLMGAREIAHGVGILRSQRPGAWVGSRVAGDALDMGLLGGALASGGASNPSRTIGALAAVAGTAAADVADTLQLRGHRESLAAHTPMRVRAAVTVNRSAEDLYTWWRSFDNLPDLMTHLKSVELLDDSRSRWTVRAPLGSSASWEAELVEDVPNELVAWQSLPGSQVENAGEVRFVQAPGGRGTEVHVLLTYDSPVGQVGAALLKLFGDDPVQQVKDDLRRFKQVMETGQVVRSEGAPEGTDARNQPKQHAARPHADAD